MQVNVIRVIIFIIVNVAIASLGNSAWANSIDLPAQLPSPLMVNPNGANGSLLDGAWHYSNTASQTIDTQPGIFAEPLSASTMDGAVSKISGPGGLNYSVYPMRFDSEIGFAAGYKYRLNNGGVAIHCT